MPFSGLHFLIAEDHEFQRTSLAAMLYKSGAATVLCAPDGQTAVALLKSADPEIDVVICDLHMPGSDGLELLRHLRDAAANASVIVASAVESRLLASIATLAQEYGIKLLGVIEKPINTTQLRALVLRHQSLQLTSSPPAGLRFTSEEIADGLQNGEFEPFFQPKIDLASRSVAGAEVLARWRHPMHGIIEPAKFLSIVEGSGLMDKLTSAMLEGAAFWAGSWRKQGVMGCISLNLSASTLDNGRIGAQINKLLDRHGLEPGNMILEITESVAMNKGGSTLEALARLRMAGFGLSIDDFGTGYSSMQRLARVAFSELKVDRSFVDSACTQSAARIILASCLDMARKLGMTSVVEGVETQEQLDLLLELGCDMGQGYLFSRPMAADAYLHWVKDWGQSEH